MGHCMKKIIFTLVLSLAGFSLFAEDFKYNNSDFRNFVGPGWNGSLIPYCSVLGIRAATYSPGLQWAYKGAYMDFYYPDPDKIDGKKHVDISSAEKIKSAVDSAMKRVSNASKGEGKREVLKLRGFIFYNPLSGVSLPDKLAFMDALRKEAAKSNPDVKFIFILDDISKSWLAPVSEIKDARALYPGAFPDLMLQKSRGVAFLENAEIYADGTVKKSDVGRACFENLYDIASELRDTALTAVNGSWSTYADPKGETGFYGPEAVPARLKISSLLPMWENLNNTPLSERVWDEESKIYYSPTAYMSEEAFGVMSPGKNKKFYFVFNRPGARVMLPKGYTVKFINTITAKFNLYPHVRRPFPPKHVAEGKMFNVHMWMSPKKPNLVLERDDGFLYLQGDAYTNEAFMAELEPKP